MNKTFGVMKTNVGNNVGDTSSEMKTIIGVYLNARLQEIRQRLNIFGSERTDYTFSTVAGTQDYVMPDDFGHELNVIDTTNGTELTRKDVQTWASNNSADIDGQGTPLYYAIISDRVRTQPTSASTITVVSSESTDNQVIHIRGLVSGIEQTADVTLNGTSEASTTKQFTRIIGVSKSAVSTGYVTITSNSGAVTVAYLAPEALVSRVTKIRLFDIPSGVIVVQVPYLVKQLPLYSDYDYPELDCEEALEYGATADSWRYKRQFAKGQQFEALYEKALANIAFGASSQPNLTQTFKPQPYSRETT